MTPTLSIIIPCYNCEQTLREAVESCYQQGFEADEFEIVMVDDGSVDGTRKLMETLASEHQNIKLIFHNTNQGGGAARNTAVENATSDVIFCLDSDDILPPQTLNKMFSFLNKKKCDGVCFEKSVKFRRNDITDIKYVNKFPVTDKPIPFSSLIEWELSPVVVVFMYTKSSWGIVNGYPTHHGFDTQGFGWLFLSAGLKVYVCPNTSYLHRVDQKPSYYIREYKQGKVNWNMKEILLEHLQLFSSEAQQVIINFNPTDFNSDLIAQIRVLNIFGLNYEDSFGSLSYTNTSHQVMIAPIARNSLQGIRLRIIHRINTTPEFYGTLKFVSLIKKIYRRLLSTLISTRLQRANKRAFIENSDYALKKYSSKKSIYNYDKFLMPEWRDNTKKIETFFNNGFPSSFLRHPLLRSTMFLELSKKTTSLQKETLRNYFSRAELTKFLLENKIGSPLLNDWEFKTSGNSIHHLYHLAKFGTELSVDIRTIKSYLELGGGYGNMAKIVKRINSDVTYVIIDIPIFNYIQYIYLSSTLGKDGVVFYDEVKKIVPGKINLIPLDQSIIDTFIRSKWSPELFVSTWALSESNQATQALVRDNLFFSAKHLLLAYQKANESFSFAQEITNVGNKYKIIHNNETEYLPDNYYLFASQK